MYLDTSLANESDTSGASELSLDAAASSPLNREALESNPPGGSLDTVRWLRREESLS